MPKISSDTINTLIQNSRIPRADAIWLIAAGLRLGRSEILLSAEKKINANDAKALKLAFYRRSKGLPLQYAASSAPFYGRDFYVDEYVLIPRPETEALVEIALAEGDRLVKKLGRAIQVIDVGAGSGVIGITIALERPNWKVGGSDISKAALKVAKKNALTLGARIDLRKGHLLKAWGDLGGVDLIISNPPYLWKNHEFVAKEALDWEPALALFPKRNRRSKLRNVGAHLAEEMLNLCEAMERFKGSIAMELSARVAYDLERTFKRSLGFARVERREDLNGRKRFLVCEKGLGGT